MSKGGVVKLDLKRAIILEDARRITEGEQPINNLYKLAEELEIVNTGEYDQEQIYYVLHRFMKVGYSANKIDKYKSIINDLCKALTIEEEDLIIQYC